MANGFLIGQKKTFFVILFIDHREGSQKVGAVLFCVCFEGILEEIFCADL